MADITEDKGIFRIVPARHAAVIPRRLGARYVWIGIAIYLLLAYFGLRGGGDLRFALVALIFSFIVYPLVLGFGWLLMVSSPDALRACAPQCWHESVGSDGFDIIYYDHDALQPVDSEHIAAGSIRDVTERAGHTYVRLSDGRCIIAVTDNLSQVLRRILLDAADEPLA